LKGKDRTKFSIVEAACAANDMHVVIAKLERADVEYGDTGWDGQFYVNGKEELCHVDKAYKGDG
jgi:hypothetical protein